MKRFAGLALLLAASALLSIALAEGAVRVFAPQAPSWLDIFGRHPALPIFALRPAVREEAETGETHWTVITDENGERVGERAPVGTACAALWLGDSFTFGHGVDYQVSFVGRVAQASPRVRHVNTAVPGYGPVQYREVLEYKLRQATSFAWIFTGIYVGNDFHDTLWNKDAPVNDGVVGDRGDLRSAIKRNSHLYRLVAVAYHRFLPQLDAPYQAIIDELAEPSSWRDGQLARAATIFRSELARIQSLAVQHGARAGFLLIPTIEALEALSPASPEAADPRLPVIEARRALEAIGADYVDASAALADGPPRDMYFPFDGHLTAEGNRRVAELILARWRVDCAGADAEVAGEPYGGEARRAPTATVGEGL